MADETKKYENKMKKLEKGVRDRLLGEFSLKKGTRGGGRASKKKKTSTTQTDTKSRTPQKYASQSAQGQKSILRSLSRGRSQKVDNADIGTPQNRKKKKCNNLQNCIDVDQADLENRRRQIARSVQ